jgi:hypothetical protein
MALQAIEIPEENSGMHKKRSFILKRPQNYKYLPLKGQLISKANFVLI